MNSIIALLVGGMSGMVAALCGVGGGIIMVPAFVLLLKMEQKTAVATSLAAIILTALATSSKNHAHGLIDWKIAIPAGLAGAVIGWLASDWLKKLQDVTLTRIFATLVIVVGVQMWIQSMNKSNLSKVENGEKPSIHKKN